MNLNRAMLVYAITHRDFMKNDFRGAVQKSIEGGITMLQVREKDCSVDDFVKQVLAVKELCKDNNIPLIVNDNVDVLAQTDVDGIHIGQDDEELVKVRAKFKDKIIGVSVSTLDEAIKAEQDGADYLGVGAMFSTDTKNDAKTIKMDTLKSICEAVKIPVCAIGGISAKNIKELKHTGVDGVSVISEIYNKEDVKKATEEIRQAISNVTSKNLLTIAGSDSSGGAGIQADLKTFAAHKKYGMSVICAVTAQNTVAVDFVEELSKEAVAKQLNSVFSDIRPDAIKIGMVSSIDTIKTISENLKKFEAENIVLDTVMVSTSGFKLLNDDAIDALKEFLFPLATIITPNIPEAEILADMVIKNEADMIRAAQKIGDKNDFAVLVKGGHLINDATDILYHNGEITKLVEERVDTTNTHGTGCTLSSAIACNIADGFSLEESVRRAKKYLVNAMKCDLDLGNGSGPLNHVYNVRDLFK